MLALAQEMTHTDVCHKRPSSWPLSAPAAYVRSMTARTCSIDGCENQRHARGYCQTHYARWRKGTPLEGPVRKLTESPEESFAARTERKGDCLVWTGATHDNGYGIIWTGSRIMRAHRWAWEREHGSIPPGMDLDHRCGNRLCCNTDHLRVTSRKQNMENYTKLNSNSRSGIRGVGRTKEGDRWRVRVKHNYREHYGGTFGTLDEAEAAAIDLRNRLFTHNDRDRGMKETA